MNRLLAPLSGLLAGLLLPALGVADQRVGLLVEGRLGDDADVVELRHRDAVRSGDGVRFVLNAERAGYVYLLALGSSGRLVALQPFSGDPEDARQEGGERRELPSAGSFLPLDKVPGRETLFAFGVAESPVDIARLIADLSKLESPEAVRAELEKRYPRLVTVALQHLPGLVELKRPSVEARRAGAPRSPVTGSGLFKGSTMPKEPDVLSGEGYLIDRLLDNKRIEGAPAVVAPPVNGAEAASTVPSASMPASREIDVHGKPGLLKRLGALFATDSDNLDADRAKEAEAGSALDARADRTDPLARGDALAVAEQGMVLILGERGAGSGALVLDRRHVLAPWHLVDGTNELSVLVRADDGVAEQSAPLRASVVRHNVFTDLALLELETPYREGIPIRIPPGPVPLKPGQQVHVLSHDARQAWRRGLAIVVQTRSEQSWFSNERVIHRGPTVELQMSEPPRGDGALVLDANGELLGLKVRTGRRQDSLTAVGLPAIRAFLGS